MKNSTIALVIRSARLGLWPAIIFNAGVIGYSITASAFSAGLLSLSLCCVAAFGFLINDYQDVNVDRVNNSCRLEHATRTQHLWAGVASGLFLVLSLLFASLLGIRGFAIIALVGIALGIYTFYARQRLVLATILAATLSSTPVWLPNAIFTSHLSVYQIGILSASVLFLMGREIAFDFGDVLGDAAGERRTFATVYGQRFALNLSVVLNILGALLLTLTLILSKVFTHFRISIAASFAYLLFIALLLIPLLILKIRPQTVPYLDNFTRFSRMAMLLLPALWLIP